MLVFVMANYRCIIPYQDDMGSINPFNCSSCGLTESAAENALWQLNSMREHDNLPKRERLPAGTKLERLVDSE